MKILLNRIIACLDMRSFYASCATADLGLDVMEEVIACRLIGRANAVSFSI